MKKFKKGAPILSTHLKAPIVPIALEGVYEVWPRGRSFRWRSLIPGLSPTRMHCGTPVPPPSPLPAGASFSQAEAHYTAAAERLRLAVAETKLVADGQPVVLSVSIGIACASAPCAAIELFRRADAELYRAKSGGRNRIVIDGREVTAIAA